MISRVRKRGRKRSLPIGVRHTRHQVTLPPAYVKRLRQRAVAAHAAGDKGASFSGEIARCVDEADGNLRSMRHALRQPLHAMALRLAFMREAVKIGVPIGAADLEDLDAMVKKIADRLEPPAAADVKK